MEGLAHKLNTKILHKPCTNAGAHKSKEVCTMSKNEKKGMTVDQLKDKAKVELGLEDDEIQEQKGEKEMKDTKSTKKVEEGKKKEEGKKTEKKQEQKKQDKAIINATALAAEFELTPKALRRKLRSMEECQKPVDGTPYQWYEDSPELKAIREKLQEQKAKRGIVR